MIDFCFPLIFGVNLEHLPSKIPEQTAFLDTPAYTAVIDALIFNRTELIEQYGIGSSDLSAMSDEELLFSIITEHGMDALAGINGDFAGVLYDKKAHTYTIPYDATNDDITLASYRTEYIFYCVNIQNTWRHAIDPVSAV